MTPEHKLVYVHFDVWPELVALGKAHGWKPAGTQPLEPDSPRMLDHSYEWRTWSKEISATDASAWADALERANVTQAAAQAGYSRKTASQIGYRLLRKVQIQQAITERTANDPAVWTREDRQRFWTAVASGATGYHRAALRDRLKASELLGKSQADFVDRVEHEAGGSLLELLASWCSAS